MRLDNLASVVAEGITRIVRDTNGCSFRVDPGRHPGAEVVVAAIDRIVSSP